MSVTSIRYEAVKAEGRSSRHSSAASSRRKLWRDDLKALVERPVALIGLLLLSPLFVVIGLLIAATTGRPVIYRRRVAAKGGGEFDAFKFRTMVEGAERVLEQDERLRQAFTVNWKLFDDPRVTPVGRLLRKYSLDELPQLVNVLRGEMSLIGPRMVSPAELERYGELKSKLLSVKPGLTGLWQISGRQSVSYAKRIELDMHYIDHCTLKFDLTIVARTFPVVIGADGAY